MKMRIFMLAGWVVLFSCAKNENPEAPPRQTEEKRYPVRLNLKDFVSKFEPLPGARKPQGSPSGRDSALAAKLWGIKLLVKSRPAGEIVTAKIQMSDDADFGELRDSLPAGDFTVMAAAITDSVDFGNAELIKAPVSFSTMLNWPELFYNKADFTVSNGGANALSMTLNRISSALEVNILDAPAEHPDSLVTVKSPAIATWFNMSTGEGVESVETPVLDFPRRNGNTFSGLFVRLPWHEIAVHIRYRDRATGDWVTKYVTNIPIQPNTKTVLTGRLYPPPGNPPTKYNHGFTVDLNEAWGQDLQSEF